MKHVVWTQGPPAFQHVSIRVKPEGLHAAMKFCWFLGWQKMQREATWASGRSVFFDMLSMEGSFLQLTVENAGNHGDPSDSNHLAVTVPDAAIAATEVSAWCLQEGVEFASETVGPGSIMIMLGFLYGAVEFVTDNWLEQIITSKAAVELDVPIPA